MKKDQTEMVWIVGLVIGADGQPVDYFVEEKDLLSCRCDIAANLRQMLGKGVFYNREQAVAWAQLQQEQSGRCCRQSEGGCNSCCHNKNPQE